MKSPGRNVQAERSDRKGAEQLFAEAFECQGKGRFHHAIRLYLDYIEQVPAAASAFNNLGNCLRSIGENEKSIRYFEHALRLEPGRVSSRLNLSLARLAVGDYLEAWPDYEARLETIEFRRELLKHPEYRWNGDPITGKKRLYVYANQGLGDELQCLRFLPELYERAERIVLELQAATVSLLGEVPDHVQLVARGEEVPSFYNWCELFSLPGIFGITPETIPETPPLVFRENPAIGRLIEERGRNRPDAMRVGLVWSGNPANSLNRFRACGLGHMAALLEVQGCQFFSLQKGLPATEIESLGLGDRIIDLGPHLDDFAATATAIRKLDLLITTDTSVPHLAGALGEKAWVLLHHPADWRWGMEGDSTPWYPSLQLYRQARMGDWGELVERVSQDLAAAARTARS